MTPSAIASSTPALSTQARANLIVAQMEREVESAAYQNALRLERDNPSGVLEFETPASVARRIFHALRSFAHSA